MGKIPVPQTHKETDGEFYVDRQRDKEKGRHADLGTDTRTERKGQKIWSYRRGQAMPNMRNLGRTSYTSQDCHCWGHTHLFSLFGLDRNQHKKFNRRREGEEIKT